MHRRIASKYAVALTHSGLDFKFMQSKELARKGIVFVVLATVTTVIGSVALATLNALVAPSLARDLVMLGIWPLLITGGVVLAWRWLAVTGSPRLPEGHWAISQLIESGEKLAQRMRDVPIAAPESEKAAWKVRFRDWEAEAADVLTTVAPRRVAAFKADLVFVGSAATNSGVPAWLASDLTDLELRIEQLRQIRASL